MGKESSGLNQNNSLPKGGDSEKGAISQFLKTDGGRTKSNAIEIPSISLPKGGGAIKGIDEKFSVNAVNGTASFSIPLPFSPARGASPALSLSYNSGAGNGVFGLGWALSLPSIKRKTDKRLPQYLDGIDSDTFLFSEAEDLVPEFKKEANGKFSKDADGNYIIKEKDSLDHIFTIRFYKPRIEGLFARIERWTHKTTGEIKWRVITKENVTTLFGWSAASRISDPKDVNKIFEWLPEFVFDDKGNCSHYIYKKEDDKDFNTSLLHNRNRTENGKITYTNLYLEKVLYGNKTPYKKFGESYPSEDNYLFKTVFDYGKYDQNVPDKLKDWDFRQDAFSEYKSGFEIRTTRLCKRVLLFHRFDGANEYNGLVKSLNFEYDTSSEADFTFLKSITAFGYIKKPDGTYSYKNLPPTEFEYQKHDWNKDVNSISPDDLVHAPAGLDEPLYQFTDLFNEGLSGILTEQANGWYYKHNLGNGQFEQAKLVTPKPSFAGLGSQLQLADLDADGGKQLVSYGSQPKGYFEISDEDEWQPFRTFDSLPNIDLSDANTRMLDLNGDGRPEALITEENVFTWYESAGRKGFTEAYRTPKSYDEEKCPHLVFADPKQTIFLADMSGDGMTDIVRIRNGEVCYWPNLGYGKFGAKVGMDNAPVFDHPDSFNPAYLRLADIDGSGTTDIIYLGKNRFSCWKNLSGNCFSSTAFEIDAFPEIHNQSKITVTDLLGNGVACIVWSSNLTKDAAAPLKYIDLMNSKKPHIMVLYKNNLGKEVSLEYTPSTKFYIEDKLAGKPWITKLHFPVHCISKVRIEDKIRETVFTSSYRYSHGYFDHHEREFRGFARVEQLDTEDFSQFKINTAKNVVEEDLHQPPVRTVSWFHTGAFLGKDKILHQCKSEYFKNGLFNEYDLPEPFIADDLTAEELREALRACKGLPLRSEVYANDNSPRSKNPYSATQSTFEIRLIQPKQDNKYASFLIIPSESISYGYERNPDDPRISHSFVLEADEFGNVTKSASVVYPRVKRPVAPNDIPDKVWEEQSKLHIVYGEVFFTDDIIEDYVYRLRVGYESKSYEISGIAVLAGAFINKKDISDQIKVATAISFEEDFTVGKQKRLFGHSRAYFLKDDLSGAMPIGKLSSLGIGHKSYQLAFTKNLVPKYYGIKVTNIMLTDAGYVHSEGDDDWWTQSGTAIYDSNPKNNFYTPIGIRDVFGNESFAEYDKYTILIKSTTDAIGNKAIATNDYRTLSPVMIIDPNLNRAAVETDELGLVIKSAVMGKEGTGEGDTLADPTARMEYDLFNWQNHNKPNYVHIFAREQHGTANPRWQESYAYSDGGGNVIMTKVQAEPGKAKRWNTVTKQVDEVYSNPRCVGNGRTILNNKGNPVKQYEPYFSTTHEYESEDALVETGITPIIYYDPVGRNIWTKYPNDTFSKVEFDAWYSKSFDVNDTVKDSQWYVDRSSPDPDLIPEPNDAEQRAAWLAAKHYNTPGIVHTDSLGRTAYATTDYGNGKTTSVYSESDLTGRYAKVFDQLGRNVSEAYTNLIGASIFGKSAEKGERWIFTDVMGHLVKIWDNNVRELRSTFDKLHRPVSTFVKEGINEILFGHVVYGDIFPDAAVRNMKGRAYQLYDQAGVVTLKKVDFKGNVVEVERKLTKEYKQTVNWQTLEGLTSAASIEAAAVSFLENEIFSSTSMLDALNRPTLVTLPDKSVVEPKYNEANFLDSLRVKIRGEGDFITFLENQDYDAKGQRQFAKYGNGLITNYFYDPKTFRLTNLVTKNDGAGDGQSLQNLHYTFDPVGNIVYSKDDAQQTHYFKNSVVKPESKFEYDALYQLLKATGREHAGLGGNAQRDNNDLPYLTHLPHINDLNAVRQYTENYQYDDCGNILQLQHIAANANWTQRYRYEYQDDVGNTTNRLKSTNMPGDADAGPYTATYQHDPHGNMTKMPHLDELVWNFMDQLMKVMLGGGGIAFYVYGLGGRRMRKVIERLGGKKIERIYLGAVEIYREYQNNNKKLERSTLHISDNTGRIAQVDTKLFDEDNADTANPLNKHLIRYQYTNHLGSAVMETDEFGTVISYEEYHPYGTSAYRSSKSNVDLSLKRYRFSGKERDDETGLYYFGARYYAAWLGRWTSSDPAGFVDGLNLFAYCKNSPIIYHDRSGTNGKRINYKLEGALKSLRGIDDPGVFSEKLRALGFDFTGFDPSGKEMKPDEGGRGVGLAKSLGKSKWTVGTWLQRPSEGQSKGSSSPSAGAVSLPPRPLIQPGPLPGPLPPAQPIPKIDLPQAPPGTDFEAAAGAGQATARAANPNVYATPGVQAHHYLKWREGERANLDPRITNDPRRIGPLQSWTSQVNDPDYPKPAPAGRSGGPYNTPHSYADRGSYPYHEDIQEQRYGGIATERVTHARAGRASQKEMTGSPGPGLPYIVGPTLMGVGGQVALAATRTFVPFVAEAEMGLMGAGMLAYNAGYTTVGVGLFSAASYVPVVGGSLVAGAIGGNLYESAALSLGASEETSVAVGAGGAALTGAAVGALIGSVLPVVGTGVGAAIGAVAGLIGYGLSKLF